MHYRTFLVTTQVTFLVLAQVVLVCCSNQKTPLNNPQEKQKVSVIKPTTQKVEPFLATFGSISFKNKTDLSAGIDGTLIRIPVNEGSSVRRDQILAEIENVQLSVRNEQALSGLRSASAALLLSKTKLSEAKAQMEGRFLTLQKEKARIEQKHRELEKINQTVKNKMELFDLQGISAEELNNIKLQAQSVETEYDGLLTDQRINAIGFRDEDLGREFGRIPDDPAEKKKLVIDLNTRSLAADITVAEARVQSAEAELNSVRLLSKDLQIRAPYQGIVGARYLSAGERVQAGTKIFTVFQENEVYAVVPLQESQIRDLKVNQDVIVTVPSLGNRVYKSRLSTISPTIDPQSGNLNIKVLLSNGDRMLRPGMFIEARVITGASRSILLIPQSALLKKERDSGMAFLVTNDRLIVQNLKLGQTREDMIEVIEGLSDSQFIVSNPAPILREGMEVLSDQAP